MSRPSILVTNDDGIDAPGINVLIKALLPLGDLFVVAPDKAQSGSGHAITINNTIRVNHFTIEGVEAYSCTGTPVDCVKMGVNHLMPTAPDLVVSGINHGPNHSINVIYSGTMSAAVEAATCGIPGIGFSLMNHAKDADFTASAEYVRQITATVLESGLPKGVCLNVNIPDLPKDQIKGVRTCRQANAVWIEKFYQRQDPFGNDYYWLTGEFVNKDQDPNSDAKALEEGFVTVVPTKFDLTAHEHIEALSKWMNS